MRENKQKLELTWIGKDKRTRLEPRILIEDPTKSYHSKKRISENDIFENKLIFGDNLLALKALESEYAGKVKCIYIDPPYNTGNAFEHYDDGLEHSIWLGLMRDRVELLWNLLSSDGLMAIQIDDNEFARLYLLLVEICGEGNLKTICIKMSEATGVKMASVKKAGSIPKLKEFIILAKKNGVRNLSLERIPKEKWDEEYKYLVKNVNKKDLEFLKFAMEEDQISDEEFLMADKIARKIELSHINEILIGKDKAEWSNIKYENSWRIVRDVAVTGNVKSIADQKRMQVEEECFLIKTPQSKNYLMKKDYNSFSNQPRCKLLFADTYLTTSVGDLWTDIKTTGLDNEGGISFKNGKKPEKLIKRIINMSTVPGDLVLDSFAGSGTTGAVAHKMGRRWIMVELGEHCHTHIIPRLKRVIDGEDSGGISKEAGWKGGGGFRYYHLAPSMLEKDKWGNWIISKEYNAGMLAEAMCKHMGFTYAPDEKHYWIHGHSTETDFIYITTAALTHEQLRVISEEVGLNRTLLICCKAFNSNPEAFNNLTIKKIPQSVLTKCEWSKDDYSLNISKLDNAEDEADDSASFEENEEV